MNYLYLCAPCAMAVLLFLKTEKNGNYVLAVILKGLASVCFVALGVLGSKLCSDASVSGPVVIGLALGFLADILLNLRFVLKKKGTLVFLVGILVFLAGHIFYLLALMPRCPGLLWYVIAGAVLTALVLKWIFARIEAKPAFKIFGVFYIGAIVIMNCVALGVLLAGPSAHAVVYMLGAVLFFISDVVLILNTFGGTSQFSLRVTNISLYYLGQLLIALSLQLL